MFHAPLPTGPRDAARPVHFAALVAALVAVTAACTATRAVREPGFELRAHESYAWHPEPAGAQTLERSPGAHAAQNAVDDAALAQRVRVAVDAGLARRGLRLAPPEEATLLVAQRAFVELRRSRNDPDYAFYTVDVYEEGTLVVELVDAATDAAMWRGSASDRIRVVSRGVGMYDVQTVETDAQRDWPVERLVSAILERLPE